MEILYAILLVTAGAIATLLVVLPKLKDQKNLRHQYAQSEALIRQYIAQKAAAEQRVNDLATENENSRTVNQKLATDLTTEKILSQTYAEKLRSQKEQLEQMQQQMRDEFASIANKLLEEKSEKFSKLNAQTVETLLNPLEKSITSFREQIEKNLTEETKQRTTLEQQIKNIVTQTNIVSTEANNLAAALKGSSKIRGNWGELILQSVLDHAGLVKDRDYQLQKSLTDTQTGSRLIPDAIINLPNNRRVIIDSKVSLIDYEKYCSTEDPEQQNIAATAHVNSIYRHIDSLRSKNYAKAADAADYVIMFVPIEPAYMLAMEKDGAIWEYGYQKRIMPISPTNLIPCLKLISDLWIKEKQQQNIEVIISQADSIYEKLHGFLAALNDVGRSIDKAQLNYQTAHKRLYTGRDNAMSQIQKLHALGLKSQKIAPELSEPTDQEAQAIEAE